MIRALFFSILLLAGFHASAQFNRKSAARDPNVSYLNYKLTAQLMDLNPPTPNSRSASDSAVPYTPSGVPNVTEWTSVDEMNSNFQKIRDERWMTTDDHPGFLRRSSWLYPDDGCFARAALAIMNLAHWKAILPNKIFVFGDLNVKTANSPTGSVSWWYHVAPIVQVQGQKYVLDPAISPRAPIKLEDWLVQMVPDASQAQVAICGSGSYVPDDACTRVSDGIEATASSDQVGYLMDEWSRMGELGRDPVQVLGDSPPWLTPAVF